MPLLPKAILRLLPKLYIFTGCHYYSNSGAQMTWIRNLYLHLKSMGRAQYLWRVQNFNSAICCDCNMLWLQYIVILKINNWSGTLLQYCDNIQHPYWYWMWDYPTLLTSIYHAALPVSHRGSICTSSKPTDLAGVLVKLDYRILYWAVILDSVTNIYWTLSVHEFQ